MPDSWLPVFTAVSAGAASVAAIASWFNVLANGSAFRGKLLSDLLDEYATEEMRRAMVAVSQHQDDPLQPAPNEEQRRKVSHYFQKVYTLRAAGTISKRFARRAITRGQAVRFLGLEPVERGINANYDRRPFKFYARLHRLPRALPANSRSTGNR
jgi:hypothetical protein